MRFLAILRDERGFVHKRLIGAVGGFLAGGPIGAVGGFFRKEIGGLLGGGGGPPPETRAGAFRRLAISRRRAPPGFAPVPTPFPSPAPTFPTLPPPTPVVPGADRINGVGGCLPGFTWDPLQQKCVLDLDPGMGQGFPGGAAGLTEPEQVCIETLVCPKFADGRKGVLWMDALRGTVICLPRGTNGSGFGLIRKNRPRRKAFVTAAEISALRGQARTKKKAKKFAGLTGQVCVTRGSRARSSHN